MFTPREFLQTADVRFETPSVIVTSEKSRSSPAEIHLHCYEHCWRRDGSMNKRSGRMFSRRNGIMHSRHRRRPREEDASRRGNTGGRGGERG